MAWLTNALGGPILAWEVRRATRRNLTWVLLFGYSAWLVVQAMALVSGANVIRPRNDAMSGPRTRLVILRQQHELQNQFLHSYVGTLLKYQLVIIIAITPALTASSLGQEKERGTLFALFCTQLSSRQILTGMLFGRLFPLMPLMLTTAPVLVFVLTWTESGLTPVLLALAQTLVIAFALGAFGLLFGIWIRRATDAVLAAYACFGLIYLLAEMDAQSLAGTHLFFPLGFLDQVLDGKSRAEFLVHVAIWLLFGFVCLVIGIARLRQVCVEQQDKKPPRRLWAFRPAIGNDPIRWRECHVIGLAPLPILHVVPRWLAVLGVFLCSAAVNALIGCEVSASFTVALADLDLVGAFASVQPRNYYYNEAAQLMGLVFILLGSLIVGIRCGTSVAEEKRRNTWDDLLLTAQSFREITNGKMWGILQAIVPYVIAYALPAFFVAWFTGLGALIAAMAWILLPCAIVLVAALSGIDMVSVPWDMDETRDGGAFSSERGPRRRAAMRERSAMDWG